MDTKLRNLHEAGRGLNILTGFFRHRAVKAAAVLIFIACTTLFAVTAVRFFLEWEGRGYAGDHAAGRPFEQSNFFYFHANDHLSAVLRSTGWYASNEAEALRRIQEGLPALQALAGDVRYYVRTPYGEFASSLLSEDAYRRHTAWRIQHGFTSQFSPAAFRNARYSWWNFDPPYPSGEAIRQPLPMPSPFWDEGFYVAENVETFELYLNDETFDFDAWFGQYEFRFALSDGYVMRLRAHYAESERVFWNYAGLLAALGLGALISFLYLLTVCGRVPNSGEKRLSPFWDKPWLDVSFAVIFVLSGLTFVWFDDAFRFRYGAVNSRLFLTYLGASTAVFASLALWWLLCVMKRLKTRTLLKHTLAYAALAAIFRPVARFFRAVYLWSPLKLQILMGKAEYFNDVADGLDRLARGDYNTPLPENGRGALLKMAQNVNAATGGLKAAVEREMTGQRFKAELITNVSHDLRTPLTSVISYADLLQSEGFHAPDAHKYLEIIQQKALRLQMLTEDLFEASKASSGETRAVLEPLDINQLVAQTVGEFGDRLSAAGLETRVSGSCYMAMADGKLLCRVFENLLRNAEKYALAGTRVYIETASAMDEYKAVITIRNISAAPLNGKAEHLAERFIRGDDARSTEGSGLGLAIVKSFMELQGGSCTVSVDGDLFKVTLTLPLASQQPE